jgi:hypothetical protein
MQCGVLVNVELFPKFFLHVLLHDVAMLVECLVKADPFENGQ